MADATTPLDQQALDLQSGLLQATMIFRRYRRGEFRFEPADAVVFEDKLVELGARFAQFTTAVNDDLKVCSEALTQAVELLDRYAPKAENIRVVPPDLPANVVLLPVVHRTREGQPK